VTSTSIELLYPEWPAPARVHACATTRIGGVSEPPWDALNLGAHVGDDPAKVRENRRRLVEKLDLPSEPRWLDQVHGTRVQLPGDSDACADAAYTEKTDDVCVVMTADCLPVLLTTARGDAVAAAHAGWRGLLDGVLEQTVQQFAAPAEEILAWLGPAIGPTAFEVGDEVRDAFVSVDAGTAAAFVANRSGHWLAGLYGLARRRLRAAGVERIYGGHWCTHRDGRRFFSYRRNGRTGRMASLIWIHP
jgi:YfiH family protein